MYVPLVFAKVTTSSVNTEFNALREENQQLRGEVLELREQLALVQLPVKKEPPEEDVIFTSVDPIGMCMDGLTLPYTRQPTFCMCAHVHVPVVVA